MYIAKTCFAALFTSTSLTGSLLRGLKVRQMRNPMRRWASVGVEKDIRKTGVLASRFLVCFTQRENTESVLAIDGSK